jgi:hypothetical protein
MTMEKIYQLEAMIAELQMILAAMKLEAYGEVFVEA